MDQINKNQLLLSSQRALLFNVIGSIKFVFVQNIDEKLIMHVYSDRDLTNEEKDIYFAVSGEIAGDFPSLNDSLSEVKFIAEEVEFECIKNVGYLIYARYESQ